VAVEFSSRSPAFLKEPLWPTGLRVNVSRAAQLLRKSGRIYSQRRKILTVVSLPFVFSLIFVVLPSPNQSGADRTASDQKVTESKNERTRKTRVETARKRERTRKVVPVFFDPLRLVIVRLPQSRVLCLQISSVPVSWFPDVRRCNFLRSSRCNFSRFFAVYLVAVLRDVTFRGFSWCDFSRFSAV